MAKKRTNNDFFIRTSKPIFPSPILSQKLVFNKSQEVFATGAKEDTSVDNSLKKVLEKGQFVLGLDDSFPPMGYRDENGEIVGFDIDVAKEVCKRLGVELVTQPIDWTAKEQELQTGNIDCIWNGFTITEERLEAMTFSEPYVDNAQVAVVKLSSGFNTLADLKGKIIGVQAGSLAEIAIKWFGADITVVGK